MVPVRAALALVSTVLLVACGGASSSLRGATVDVRTFRFSPHVLRIASGTSVAWRNHDRILHTVTSGIAKRQGVPGVSADVAAQPDGRFNGTLGDAGSEFDFTFRAPGRFAYFCSAHTGMSGEVIVT